MVGMPILHFLATASTKPSVSAGGITHVCILSLICVCAIQGPVCVIQGTCVIDFVTVDCAGWNHGKHVAECVCGEL